MRAIIGLCSLSSMEVHTFWPARSSIIMGRMKNIDRKSSRSIYLLKKNDLLNKIIIIITAKSIIIIVSYYHCNTSSS